MLKTLLSPLDCKEIQPVNPKGNQSWIFIGRTDSEAETPILWPPDVKNWLIKKEIDAGKDWRRRRRGWDGWMASLTPRTWVWVNSRSWWWTGRPGMLQPMELQRVGHNWATELNWTEHVPAHQNKTQIPPQPFSLIRKFPQASYPYPSEGRQSWNHSYRKLTKLITWTTALSNSMKLSHAM